MRISGYIVVPAFLVVGPPLGTMVFLLLTVGGPFFMAEALDTRAWLSTKKLLSIYLINSYFLGLLPAAAASVCYLIGIRKNWPFYMAIGVTCLVGLIAAGLLPLSSGMLDEVALSMTAAGAVSAFLIALFFESIRKWKTSVMEPL